ncbi:rhodanese-like domain-containing protein [Thermus tengchongensis]|uniref:Rhodanese-like domain-containing protein n=1 Tax=Thermus tengchongensis TaxID=1214928 RepID=A0ABY2K502_9DEIN|nr:rhodanese-like domain-containing protein [Thermus tengchongensis]TFU15477.1 rhodanese-like domain-containing protein [Thermus tengchongensis]
MKGMKKLAWLGLLLVLPVLAQATTATFSAGTVRELGNFLTTLPADFYGIQPAAAKQMMDTLDVFVLDVREPSEYKDGRIPGAVNIPIRDLPKRLSEIPKGKPIIVYCGIGHRGAMALVFLKGQGYNVKSILGGYKAWTGANLPVEK